MSTEMQTFEGSRELAVTSETASTVLAAQAKALVEARMTVALKFPRNEDDVRQKLLKECKRPSFASVAIYSKPVGGKQIQGPSIRFAETAVRCMKNLDVQTPTIYDDESKRILRVTVIDMESNTAYSQDLMIEKTVERKQLKKGQTAISSRLNSYGETVHLIQANEDELLTKQAALVSKAIRTLGLRLVPGDLIDEALSMIRQTMQNEDAQDPDAAKRRLFDAFADLGVNAKQLITYLGHEAQKLSPKELENLRGIYTALKNAETTWAEIMESKGQPEGEQTKPSNLKEHLSKKPKDAPIDQSPLTIEDVKQRLKAATNEDEVNAAWELIEIENVEHTKEQHKELGTLYTQRMKQLQK